MFYKSFGKTVGKMLATAAAIVAVGTAAAQAADVEQFVFEVTIPANNRTFEILLDGNLNGNYSKSYNWTINWGDGVTETRTGTQSGDPCGPGIPHTYSSAGTYTITITPNGSTEAWFGAFGTYNSSLCGSLASQNMITKLISPLTPLMTRTQAQINGTAPPPNFEWATTFPLTNNLTMGDEFTFSESWNNITTVGNYFAYWMFRSQENCGMDWDLGFSNGICTGVDNAHPTTNILPFNMSPVFNLPQGITTVGNSFAQQMFEGRWAHSFTMNAVFNFPQGITGNVGNNFAYGMFSTGGMAASSIVNTFAMNAVFNFPPNITTVGNSFAARMFEGRGRTSSNYSMNAVFNLPQGITGNVGDYFAHMMFDATNESFTMNDVFTIPQGITAVGDYFAASMFEGTGNQWALFQMNSVFNLPQNITTVGDYFAHRMFNGQRGDIFTMNAVFNLPPNITTVGDGFSMRMFDTDGNASELYHNGIFTMNTVFNMPQGITAAGDDFASRMFNGRSGNIFTMNAVFNLPQNITSVGNNFAEAMFMVWNNEDPRYSNMRLSPDAMFNMSPVFNLPPGITSVGGDNFAGEMFRGRLNNAFTMNSVFNLPQGIIGGVGNNFAYRMFYGCMGNSFTMNDVFNLPQGITAVSVSSDNIFVARGFASEMFYDVVGNAQAFQVNDVFKFPPLSQTELNKGRSSWGEELGAFFRTFYSTYAFRDVTQTRTAASIINNTLAPNANRETFTNNINFTDVEDIHVNWGGGMYDKGREPGIVYIRNDVANQIWAYYNRTIIVTTARTVLQNIADHFNGADVKIHFGDPGETLDMGTNIINISDGDTPWGKITLLGNITSSGTITIVIDQGLNAVIHVESYANISNTRAGGGNAIQLIAGTLDIKGGTIEVGSATNWNTVINVPNNNTTSGRSRTINISGGTLRTTGGATSNSILLSLDDRTTVNISGGTLQSGSTAISAITTYYTNSQNINISGNAAIYGPRAQVFGDNGVINQTVSVGGDAVVIAFDAASAGSSPSYNEGSSTNITTSPAGMAVWSVGAGGVGGIAYANGNNNGFIPVPGVTVTADDNFAIEAVKNILETTTHTAPQRIADDSLAAHNAAISVVNAIASSYGVTAVVDGVSFTSAVAGTQPGVAGTDGIYTFTVRLSRGTGTPQTTTTLTLGILSTVSIFEIEREVLKPEVEEVVVVAPVERAVVALTVGPNPVDKNSGSVNFYLTQNQTTSTTTMTPITANGSLTIFDATGNVVRRLDVADVLDVVEWDLRDSRGRLVTEGTYLIRGSLMINGKRERVSALVGVR